MKILKEKFKNINIRLASLLYQLKYINIEKLDEIPQSIDEIVVAENKALSYLNKTIQEVSESDLKGITHIPYEAFYYYKNLTSIAIPNSVTSIGDHAFYYCTSLASITIPEGVTSIDEYAFSSCTGLKSITISGSVTSIGYSVFQGCKSITDIYLNSIKPPYINSSFPSTTIIHVPVGSGEVYRNATNWSSLASQIVEDIVIE